jgi:hypothetical protein
VFQFKQRSWSNVEEEKIDWTNGNIALGVHEGGAKKTGVLIAVVAS